MSSEVGQLSQGPGQNHVADLTQVLEQQTLVVRDVVPAQQRGLHDPLGKRHGKGEFKAKCKILVSRKRASLQTDNIQVCS